MNSADCRQYLSRLEFFGIKLGLENIRALLESLGNPQKKYPGVLVAGTNGKGSVSAMLARVLTAHGYRVGLYTSPHLVRVEERIRLNGRMISPRAFCRHLTALKELIDKLLSDGRLPSHPTYFEVLTALALDYFERRKVDIAVLEVGMGGRFDATNAVDPVVSVITTISRDHEQHLGGSLGRIAFEKAGIIRPGVPVVCAVKRGTACSTIKKRARAAGSPFIEVFAAGRALSAKQTTRGYRFLYKSGDRSYAFSPALSGRHQGNNGAVAIAAAEILSKLWRPLDKEKIIDAVETTEWEGRLEVVCRKPLILLDGAHNEEGAGSLRQYLRDKIRRPVILIFAAMKDKNIRKMAELLFPLAEKIVLTKVSLERAATPEEILAKVKRHRGRIILEPDVGEALKIAFRESRGRVPIIIAGSLFLVGEIKKLRLGSNLHI